MKNVIILSIIVASALLTGCSTTNGPKTEVYYVNATVNDVFKAPEICSVERANAGHTLGGAIIGGLIGNQIGSGNGRKAATVAGVLIGANAGSKTNKREGNKLKCKRNGYIATVSFMAPNSNQMVTDNVQLSRRTYAKMLNIPVCVTGNHTYACL